MKDDAKPSLVADVGGTNTRVAICRCGVPEQVQHFANADFASIYEVLECYLEDKDVAAFYACSMAMAGPVHNGAGRLTNRDWLISKAELARVLPCDKFVLMNDLTALGHALQTLPAESKEVVDQPAKITPNRQSLVVGIGTGFNLCPVRVAEDGNAHCFEVEMGHAALPSPVKDALVSAIGKDAVKFLTLEHLFSGDGLAEFHAIRTGGSCSAKQLVQEHEVSHSSATETLELYTRLLYVLSSELAFQYMPMDGIYFAGSVARGILRPEFHRNLQGDGKDSGKVGNLLWDIPKWTILEDSAALRGCIAAFG